MFNILDEIRDEMETALSTSFKKYYVGKVHEIPINYLPIFMIYGPGTLIEGLSTVQDKYRHAITIEILTSAYAKVNIAEDSDSVLQAQKQIWDFMEKKDANNTPLATSIVGVLRGNILGSKFLFHDEYSIKYSSEKVENRVFYKGLLEIPSVVSFNARP